MMASAFDVAGRLSEGDGALATLDDYVAACQVLGLQCPASLSDLYRAESGLDLAALSADARSLDAAAVAARDALRLQGNGYRELAAQWSGAGGDAAGGFLRTLTIAAEDVVAHLQRSAQALTTLRDELWRAVDTKVDAVMRADAQAAGRRDEWSAAARAVLGGAGDVSAASEIVDQQVKPFVLRVVYGELLPTLQDGSDFVAAEYDSAIAAVTPVSVSFAVPFVLAPEWGPSRTSLPSAAPAYQAAAATPVGALGAAASWAPGAPVTGAPAVQAAPVAPEVPVGPEQALGSAVTSPVAAGVPGDLGSGSGVGGLGGLGQQLADAFGGALGSIAGFGSGTTGLGGLDDLNGGLTDDLGLNEKDDTADPEDPDEDEDPDDDKDPDEDEDEDPDEDKVMEEADEEAPSVDEVVDGTDEKAVEPPPSDAGQPPPAPTLPPAPAPASVAEPAEPAVQEENPVTKTPCQIAADQLPLAGD